MHWSAALQLLFTGMKQERVADRTSTVKVNLKVKWNEQIAGVYAKMPVQKVGNDVAIEPE